MIRGIILAVGDVAAVVLVAVSALYLTHSLRPDIIALLPHIAMLTFFGQAASRSYASSAEGARLGNVLQGALMSSGAFVALHFLDGSTDAPLAIFAVTALASILGVLSWRAVTRAVGQELVRLGHGRRKTILIAERDRAWEFLEYVHSLGDRRLQMVGHLTPRLRDDPTALGHIGELARFIEELDATDVIVAGTLDHQLMRDVMRTCFLHGTAVGLVPGTLTEFPCRLSSREILGWPMLELRPPGLHMVQIAAKRLADICASSVLLLLCSPLLLGIAVAIRWCSPGPVLFRQPRPGLAGRKFGMLKFRTMRADAEAVLRADPEMYQRFIANDCKLPADEDPRIFPLGRFLRSTSLDELPQLLNVLMGDMSLIGPRPVVGPELQHYGESMSTVLAVRPGMTGYWQVAGRSSIVFPERAHLDTYYVTNWSIGLDLKILAMTVPAVIRRAGAH